MRFTAPMAAFLAASAFLVCAAAQAKQPASTPGYDPTQVEGVCQYAALGLWNKADGDFDAGDYPRAVALDRIIVGAVPWFIEAYATGAWLLDSMGDKTDAEAFYKLAIDRNPKNSDAYYNLGFFYFNSLHDYNKARAVFQADVETPTADVNDWKMLAHCYEHLHQYDKALAVWEETKKLYPNGPAVDFNLAQAKRRAAQENAASHGG